MDEIVLRHGRWRAAVRPALGGALTRLEVMHGDDWLPLLRSAPLIPCDVLDTACFPTAPFFGRLRGSRFFFRGRTIALPPIARHPTPLHGFVWYRPWQAEARTDAVLTLSCLYAADAWPWPFLATQTYALNDEGLAISLMVRNAGSEAMPCGIGLHPYFPCDTTTRLLADVESQVVLDHELLPITATPEGRAPMAGDMRLERRALHRSGMDCSFEGWTGTAIIEQPTLGYRLRMTARDVSHLHIYAPADGEYFCVEPVSHAIDAFNLDEARLLKAGARILAPGESQQMQLRLSLEG